MALGIRELRSALAKQGKLDPDSPPWIKLREVEKRWEDDQSFRRMRDKAAFHVDADVIDKGLDELAKEPGVCPNTLALPIDDTDDTVLSIIEGQVLGTDYLRELLSLVENAPDETAGLIAERDRLQTEVDHLVTSIAAGVPGDAVAPAIREKHSAIAKLQQRLQIPRPTPLDHERLRPL